MFDDRPLDWEAWDIDIYHQEKIVAEPVATSTELVENGPLRAALRTVYPLGPSSRMTQRISLTALGARLDFDCEVDWHEERRLLKVEFPWAVRAMHATYEVQFGHIQRPTHFNTSWDLARFEVCAHRWVDLSEPDYGVALLNDCKYGHATHGNVMRLSLLRSTQEPDPTADRGAHAFRYAVFPHAGNLQAGGVVTEAMNFNTSLRLRTTDAQPTRCSWFQVDHPAVVLDTVKRAEDSEALVLRLYEAHGITATARLTSALPVTTASACNLLEEETERLPWDGGLELVLRPFELLTLKLTTGDEG
jgi:alpha-mannosidase